MTAETDSSSNQPCGHITLTHFSGDSWRCQKCRKLFAFPSTAPETNGWQPIDTRPKDLESTYLVTNGRQVAPWIRGVIHNNTGTPWDWDYGSNITGWQPLPGPPQSQVKTTPDPTGNWPLEVFKPLPPEEASILRDFVDDSGGDVKTSAPCICPYCDQPHGVNHAAPEPKCTCLQMEGDNPNCLVRHRPPERVSEPSQRRANSTFQTVATTNLRAFVARSVDEWLAGSLDATSAMGRIRDSLGAAPDVKGGA